VNWPELARHSPPVRAWLVKSVVPERLATRQHGEPLSDVKTSNEWLCS
jgi:hypothetical protein